MPIYAFECDACGHNFERLQKLSDADPTACPVCGAEPVRRQLTAPQFRLAGGGWYETDFKKEGDKKRNLAGEGSSGGKESAKESSESKAADSTKPAESKSTDNKSSKTGQSKPAAPAKADTKPTPG